METNYIKKIIRDQVRLQLAYSQYNHILKRMSEIKQDIPLIKIGKGNIPYTKEKVSISIKQIEAYLFEIEAFEEEIVLIKYTDIPGNRYSSEEDCVGAMINIFHEYPFHLKKTKKKLEALIQIINNANHKPI